MSKVCAVSADIIVSYDGTPNDDDALALGTALAAAGGKLALAYVRHSREFDPRREELAQHDAERRLRTGQDLIEDHDVPTHVIFSASTDSGLDHLARTEGASILVFGSDYRTAPGRAEPGNTAQRLLEGGPIAIGIAQAGLRTTLGSPIGSIAISSSGADPAVTATATALAAKLGARLVDAGSGADLIVVGSRPDSPAGRISLSGATRSELSAARSSVLVLPAATVFEL